MSPTKKQPARKPVRRAAPRTRAAQPPAPPPWSDDIRELNVVWYNVSDWVAAQKFYGETLGLPVAFALEEAGWIEYGRTLPHLAINRWTAKSGIPIGGGGVATLTCPDVRGTIARLRAKGVRCDEVEELPGMVILGTFYDPDGNKLQLAQSLIPPG